MFISTTTPYPIYSSPTLYPLSHYVVTPSVPTARERYLQAVAEAQSARARYLSELEEQRILASLQQREALRQVEFRQRQIFATRNDIARHRVGRIYAENLCRPVPSLQGRGQAFARRQRENSFPAYEPQNLSSNLETVVSALLGGRDEYMIERENEKVRVEEVKKEDVLKARARFVRMLERVLEATHADPQTHTTQPSKPSNNAPTTDPSHVPLSCRTEIPRNPLARERAARTIQQRWRSHSADALARKDAIATIATIRARLQFLKDTFSFPEHLEFKEHVADQRQQVPALLFTPANAAVHAYSHELTKLLTLADAVPSHGSRRVREERRSFVRLVEEALDSVDRRVAEVWGNRTEASVTKTSGMDDRKTPSTVPHNVVHFGREPVVHSSEPDVSVLGIDSTIDDSELLGSSSTDASTIIPSHVITKVDPPTLNSSQASEVLLQGMTHQDVASESEVPKLPPTPVEALISQPDAAIIGSIREDHDVAVQTQLSNIDIQATKDLDVIDTLSPSSTLSQPQPLEASQLSPVGNTEVTGVEIVPTSEGIDLTSSSAVPGLTTAQSFDAVYPDSTLSSPLVVDSDIIDLQELKEDSSMSIEGDIVPISREVGHKVQNSLQEIEEEAFELL